MFSYKNYHKKLRLKFYNSIILSQRLIHNGRLTVAWSILNNSHYSPDFRSTCRGGRGRASGRGDGRRRRWTSKGTRFDPGLVSRTAWLRSGPPRAPPGPLRRRTGNDRYRSAAGTAPTGFALCGSFLRCNWKGITKIVSQSFLMLFIQTEGALTANQEFSMFTCDSRTKERIKSTDPIRHHELIDD